MNLKIFKLFFFIYTFIKNKNQARNNELFNFDLIRKTNKNQYYTINLINNKSNNKYTRKIIHHIQIKSWNNFAKSKVK